MSEESQSSVIKKEMYFHDSIADKYDEALELDREYLRLINNRRINEVVDLIRDGHARILEVGCGTGHVTVPLLERINSRSKLYAIDLSKKMIHLNKSSLKGSTNVLHIQGSGTELPLKENAFDLIVCIATLHHIPNYHQVIKEFERVLVPGGRIYLNEPLANPFLLQWRKRLLGHQPVVSPYEQQFKGFNRVNLLKRLSKYFSIEDVSFRGLLGGLFSWIHSDKFEKILFRLDTLMEKLSVFYHFSTITVIAQKT